MGADKPTSPVMNAFTILPIPAKCFWERCFTECSEMCLATYVGPQLC